MPEWFVAFLVGGSAGGLAGYLLRAWVDDQFIRRKEKRDEKRADLKAQREAIIHFIGQPRAHFIWLETVPFEQLHFGKPSIPEKVEMIAGWCYANSPRFPAEIQRHLALIRNVAYQLAVGDRNFLET